MTPLRRRMAVDMQVRNLSLWAHHEYAQRRADISVLADI